MSVSCRGRISIKNWILKLISLVLRRLFLVVVVKVHVLNLNSLRLWHLTSCDVFD